MEVAAAATALLLMEVATELTAALEVAETAARVKLYCLSRPALQGRSGRPYPSIDAPTHDCAVLPHHRGTAHIC